MKQSVYEKLEDIPQSDRDENNYQHVGGKYVLLLDGAHPVQIKNTELLSEKAQRESAQQIKIGEKDAEIARLQGELTTAKQATGVPAGQVAIPAEDAALLGQVKALGKFEDVKTKLEAHDTLKAEVDAQKRKETLVEAAKAHGFDPDAFVLLAEPKKLNEVLEMRLVDDGKGKSEKVKQFFVKGKDPATNQDTFALLSDYVKTDDTFKPFLGSLIPKTGTNTVQVPNNGTGDVPKEVSGAAAYIGKAYKRPDAAKAA